MNIDYISGFVDGEGSITISKSKVRVTIPQTNLKVLEEIKEFFGVGNIFKVTKRKPHWKDAWVYYTGGNIQSYKVLCALDGHLIIKQEKLKEAKLIIEEFLAKEAKYKRDKMEALSMTNKGLSYRQIENITGISRTTICNELKKVRGSA